MRHFDADGSPPMSRTRILEIALALTSCVVALAIAELVARTRDPVPYMRPPSRLPDDAWCEVLHRRSDIPGLAYELAPNREKNERGALIRTNSFGMRDDEPHPKGADVRRIVVLGDSFTFGFGVSGDETYPNVLERLLNEGSDEDRFEVLNFGVGGYSTRDEVLTLRHKGMAWDPELVVIGYTLNDPEIDPIQPLHRYFQTPSWWQHSELLRLIAWQEYRWDKRRLGHRDYHRYLHAHPRKWRSVADGFAEISGLAREKGVHALVVIFPETLVRWSPYLYEDLHHLVGETARLKGLHVLDLYDTFSAFPVADLALSPNDHHPSPLAHELAAQAISLWMAGRSSPGPHR
jgi:lysophospholipase L1-like esterase